jgi:hypothetical protein
MWMPLWTFAPGKMLRIVAQRVGAVAADSEARVERQAGLRGRALEINSFSMVILLPVTIARVSPRCPTLKRRVFSKLLSCCLPF